MIDCDVILNPDAYADFLVKEYENAYADGVITDKELEELKLFNPH